MFCLFSRPDVTHSTLGRLHWRHRVWVGAIDIPGLGSAEIRLHGDKAGPSPADTARLQHSVAHVEELKQAVATQIFEHYSAYKDADSSGKIFGTEEPLPVIAEPGKVWEHTWEHVVRVGPYRDPDEVELCFRVEWDIEHTLGALFKGTRLVELCASILLPRS